jgi:hypothetical protein
MSFPQWLRSNSEYHLICDAQDQMARKMGFNPPNGPKSLSDHFWRRLFVPIYKALPWGVRKSAMQMLPGSHRKAWPKPRSPKI